jgi:hypothetical protein
MPTIHFTKPVFQNKLNFESPGNIYISFSGAPDLNFIDKPPIRIASSDEKTFDFSQSIGTNSRQK